MEALYNDEEFKDITFITYFEGNCTKIKAHKAVLATCQSSYFNTLLKGKYKESYTNEVKIDCNPDILQIAIKSIYGILTPENINEEINKENRLEVTEEYLKYIFDAASLFDCHNLIARLFDLQNLSNRLLLVDLALQYNDEFIKYIDRDFCSNFCVLVDYFEQKYADNELRIELITKLAKSVRLRPVFVNKFFKINLLENDVSKYFLNRELITELLKKCDISFLLINEKIIIRLFVKLGYIESLQVIKYYQYRYPVVLEEYPLKVGFKLRYEEFTELKKSSEFELPKVSYIDYFSSKISEKDVEKLDSVHKINYVEYVLYEE